MEQIAYLGETLYRWRVGNSTFLALPERGARLMNWHLTLGDGSVRDVLYWPELSSLDNFDRIRGGNPILFPFNARSFDHGDIYFWRDPAGVRRPMPMHGFARQGRFKITRLDAAGFAATLVPDAEALAAYPYDYEFTVTYHFTSLALACELTLRNLGTEPIPWSAGHHFYFTAPWTEGQTRSDYAIRIPATRAVRPSVANGQLDPVPSFNRQEPLDNPALLGVCHLGLKNYAIVFGPVDSPGGITIHHGSDPVPHPEATIVTWTEAPESPFYCVEPWMGPPNAPETKEGLHWVKPGQSQSFVVDVNVK